ncbi:MAG: low specificity L-threonine aldolase [Clostridia bacterium]|nr:low specificity L-threonine aldolase [Clostridia bacterium]
MLSFESDYIEGAHQKILDALIKTNLEKLSGYGNDIYCDRAKEKIKKVIGNPNAEVYFTVGGTQTNQLVISSVLKPYEGVISAVTGHINGHEAGAIEYSGHKVLCLPQYDGKISADDLAAYIESFFGDDSHDHMVFPGMVYISHPTEYGTLYSKSELEHISNVCKKYNLPLFLDGARLGYGLMSDETDLSIKDIARLCDIFYIGGTKVGALCGEAVVFKENTAPKHFFTSIKQHGALLAKGRLLGIQFDTLFTDDLYFNISRHAIEMANLLKEVFVRKGYTFYKNSPTNQQFILLDNKTLERLKEKVLFTVWEKPDQDHTAVRFTTSWATTEKDIEELEKLL